MAVLQALYMLGTLTARVIIGSDTSINQVVHLVLKPKHPVLEADHRSFPPRSLTFKSHGGNWGLANHHRLELPGSRYKASLKIVNGILNVSNLYRTENESIDTGIWKRRNNRVHESSNKT